MVFNFPSFFLLRIDLSKFVCVLSIVNFSFSFKDLFTELEHEKDKLNLSSFGLSFNTLEQVFLKVGELVGSQKDEIDGKKAITEACTLFGREELNPNPFVLILMQIVAVFYRYCVNAYRNKLRTFLPLILATVLFAIAEFGHIHSNKEQVKDLSLNALEPVTIPIQLNQEGEFVADFPYIAGKLPGCVVLNVHPSVDLKKEVLKHSYDSPALGIGAHVASNGTVYVYFNGASYHGSALALSFATNSILQEKADSIKSSIEVYSTEASDLGNEAPVNDILVNILTLLCFSFLTSVFVMPLVEDRESRFKHQLLLTKMGKYTYWFAVILWNAVIYIIFCCILRLILFISGSMQQCMEM